MWLTAFQDLEIYWIFLNDVRVLFYALVKAHISPKIHVKWIRLKKYNLGRLWMDSDYLKTLTVGKFTCCSTALNSTLHKTALPVGLIVRILLVNWPFPLGFTSFWAKLTFLKRHCFQIKSLEKMAPFHLSWKDDACVSKIYFLFSVSKLVSSFSLWFQMMPQSVSDCLTAPLIGKFIHNRWKKLRFIGTALNVTSSTTNLTWTDMGSNLCLCPERPTTKCPKQLILSQDA